MAYEKFFEYDELGLLRDVCRPFIMKERGKKGKSFAALKDNSMGSGLLALKESGDSDPGLEDLEDTVTVTAEEMIRAIRLKYGALSDMASRKEFMSALVYSKLPVRKLAVRCFLSVLYCLGYIKKEALIDKKLRVNTLGDQNDGKALSYITHLAHLPFGITMPVNSDFEKIERALNRKVYGLHEVKEKVVEHLVLAGYSKKAKAASPLLLIGPPGTGKTMLGEAVAGALGLPFKRISFAGNCDIIYFKGSQYGWGNSTPGIFIRSLEAAECENFVMLLDEVDKSGGYAQGEVINVLAEVLDPMQSDRFQDMFMEVPVDLSRIFFICTANDINRVPEFVRDRCNVIEVRPYTAEERAVIIKDYLTRQIADENGWDFKVEVSGPVAGEIAGNTGSLREGRRSLMSLVLRQLKARNGAAVKKQLLIDSCGDVSKSLQRSQLRDAIGFRFESGDVHEDVTGRAVEMKNR